MKNQICIDLYTEKTYYWMTQYPLKKQTGIKWSYYTITTDKKNVGEITKNALKSHIKFNCYEKQWSRSSNYRVEFFKCYSPPFRCRYCNRKLTPDKVVVDHIVPVSKAKKSQNARHKLTIHGIKDVNDPKNLAPSCESCNKRKGNKMGLWYIRGILGKYKAYWVACYLILAALVLMAVYSLIRTDFFHVIVQFV